jgi:hypothetical protein
MNADVEPEKRGVRNITIPFDPSDGNGSKSVISCEKSGPDAEFVTVRVMPSLIVRFPVAVIAGETLEVVALTIPEYDELPPEL